MARGNGSPRSLLPDVRIAAHPERLLAYRRDEAEAAAGARRRRTLRRAQAAGAEPRKRLTPTPHAPPAPPGSRPDGCDPRGFRERGPPNQPRVRRRGLMAAQRLIVGTV